MLYLLTDPYNKTQAQEVADTIFKGQNLQDGRIPRSTFWTLESAISEYAQEIFFWSSNLRDDLGAIPMEVFALEVIAERCPSQEHKTFVKNRLRNASAHLDWWMLSRSGHDGSDLSNLVYTIHPWESAMDATPVYDSVYNVETYGYTSQEWNELKIYPNFIKTLMQYKLEFAWNEVSLIYLSVMHNDPYSGQYI